MIDWIAAIRTIKPSFDNEGWGGAKSYDDPEFGEISFLYHGNSSKLQLIFINVSGFCRCTLGLNHVDCKCDWEAFRDNERVEKTFTKKQVLEIKQPSLF